MKVLEEAGQEVPEALRKIVQEVESGERTVIDRTREVNKSNFKSKKKWSKGEDSGWNGGVANQGWAANQGWGCPSANQGWGFPSANQGWGFPSGGFPFW